MAQGIIGQTGNQGRPLDNLINHTFRPGFILRGFSLTSQTIVRLLVLGLLQSCSGIAAAVLTATACPSGQCPGLGQGFALNTINVNDC